MKPGGPTAPAYSWRGSIALLFVACASRPPPAKAPPGPPTDCSPHCNQICIELTTVRGMPAPANAPPNYVTYQCAAAPMYGPPEYSCTAIVAGHQKCEALFPTG